MNAFSGTLGTVLGIAALLAGCGGGSDGGGAGGSGASGGSGSSAGDHCQAYAERLLAAGCEKFTSDGAKAQADMCEAMRSNDTKPECRDAYDAQFACMAAQEMTCVNGNPTSKTTGGCATPGAACAQCNGSPCGMPF